jgi:hypothetical protein
MYKTILSKPHLPKLRVLLSMLALGWLGFQLQTQISGIPAGWSIDFFGIAPGLLMVLSLTVLNIYCEAQKWMVFLPNRISSSKAFTAVLAGMCSGFFTPHRIGEFSGRYMVLIPSHREGAISATFMGSFIQGFVTLIFGVAALILISIPNLEYQISDNRIAWMALLLLSLPLVLYFPKPRNLVRRFWLRFTDRLRQIELADFIKAFAWGLIRYLVFSTQLALSLYLFGFTGDVFFCFGLIAILYLAQTYFPFSIGSEIGIREVLAVLLIGPFMSAPVHAALATLCVWIVNILIPVLTGSFILQRHLGTQVFPSFK